MLYGITKKTKNNATAYQMNLLNNGIKLIDDRNLLKTMNVSYILDGVDAIIERILGCEALASI